MCRVFKPVAIFFPCGFRARGVLVCLLCVLTLAPCVLFNNFQEGEIKRMARALMTCGQIPGMSFVVVKGSDWWIQPMGVANMTSNDPVKDSTKFVIGSLTKAFTSTLLLMLLKESKDGFGPDTPLKDILHQDDLFPDPERSSQATVKDVLSHRMGLARADLALFAGYPENFSLQNLSSALTCLPVQSPFRDRFIYSNFMYSLAGHVIERLSNQSYADVLLARILQPLGMTSTLTSYDFSSPDQSMAQPYMSVGGKVTPADHSLFKLPVFLPALGLASNAPDMTRWLQAILRNGVSRSGRQVIPPEIIAMTQYPVTPYVINQLRPRYSQPELTFAYGMGWFQSVYKGFRRVWHAGSLYGFTSLTWLFPDLNMGVFVTTNGPARTPDTKAKLKTLLSFIVDPLLGFPPWIDQSNACVYPFTGQQRSRTDNSRKSKNNNSSANTSECIWVETSYNYSTRELKMYTGIYHNSLFGHVVVKLSDQSSLFNISRLHQECAYTSPNKMVLKITFGERFSGILISTASKNVFKMEPVGIFEFSAHPKENEQTTMPVEFLSLDKRGIPYSLKAVWQAVENIQYNRRRPVKKCYETSVVSSGSEIIHKTSIDIMSTTVVLTLCVTVVFIHFSLPRKCEIFCCFKC